VIDLDNNTAIKLTTALYYTPNMRSIQAEGIKPDIKLDEVTVAAKTEEGFKPIKEADLSGHLSNGNKQKALEKAKQMSGDKDRLALATEDYPVYEALNLLKGLNLLNARK
jgi:carboxyl-terminal processing protease